VGGLKALADAIGVDHVGIGSDTDILSSRAGQSTNAAWPGMSGGFFKATVAEMLRQGFTPEEIAKVGGGNFCRVFDKVTSGHT
ncbi:membrane dipeptidase, partial [Singulisphaera rosea]